VVARENEAVELEVEPIERQDQQQVSLDQSADEVVDIPVPPPVGVPQPPPAAEVEQYQPQQHPLGFFSLYFGTSQLFSNDPDEEVFGFSDPVNNGNAGDVQPLSSIVGLSSKVATVTTVRSPVNLNRVSLQLIPREESGTYHVQFIFDSTVPCVIRIFFFQQ
jgi:hypothetical protein